MQGWGEALVNPTLRETVVRVLGIYRETVTKLVQRAQAAGQIDTAVDPAGMANTLLSLYYGLELAAGARASVGCGGVPGGGEGAAGGEGVKCPQVEVVWC